MRLRSRLAGAHALALLLAFATAGTPARGDDVADEADLQFQIGAERYRAGDFRGAVEHFLASNRLAANRNVLFNIARSYEALRSYPDAYRYYTRALEGERDPAPIAAIQQALARLEPHVARLHVVTDPPGATLYLDRRDLGQRGASPQTLGLAAGRYAVIAEAPGYEDAVSAATVVEEGHTVEIQLRLRRILGTVHVSGEDAAGASIRVDAEEGPVACVAPCDLELPPGPHTLYASRPGYRTSPAVVEVQARATVTARPSVEARTGTLVVRADEPGAVVEVDGVARGPMPALLNLPVGPHRVRVTLRGFRAIERAVTLEAGRETRLEDLRLVPAEEVEAASRSAERVEDAPASVTVISSRELRGLAVPTVWEALRGVRGVFLSDDRGYATVGFRGFSRPGDYGNRTLVLLNGQPMNDDWVWSSYVGYDLRTDLEDVERIEVVRGPGSVLYGTGAFSGVINVVTRDHDAEPGYEVGGGAAPDGAIGHARARAAWRLGDQAGAWMTVAAAESAGTPFFFPEYAATTPPSIAGHTPASSDRFESAMWTGAAWWGALKVQWSLNSHGKHLPTGQFGTLLGDDRTRQTDTRGMIEARFEPQVSATLQSLSRAAINEYAYDGEFASNAELGGLQHDGFRGVWTNLEQRFAWTPRPWLRVTAGGELDAHVRADQFLQTEVVFATSTRNVALDDHRSFQVGAGYAVADVMPARWVKLSLGGRYDDYSTFGGSFNPRVAVIFHPGPDDDVKLLSGKAFRAPSVYELYYAQPGAQIGNSALQAESMVSFEVEYSHRFAPELQGLVSLYDNTITNLISQQLAPGTPPSAGILEYRNTDAPVSTTGVETELRREWKDGWVASASYSFQRSTYLRDGTLGTLLSQSRDPTRREVPNAPQHLAAVRAAAPILGRALLASTRLSFTGPRFDRNDTVGTPTDPTPPQQQTTPALVWDLVLTGSEPRWHVRYSLGLYNVLDWQYAVPVSSEFLQTTIPQPGRSLLANGYVDF